MILANSQKNAQVLAMAVDIETGVANPKLSFYNGAIPATIDAVLVAGNKLLIEFDLGANAFEDSARVGQDGKLYLNSVPDVNGLVAAGTGTAPTFGIMKDGNGNRKQIWTAGVIGAGTEFEFDSTIVQSKAKSLGSVYIQAP
ncbi:MAG: hypothetical protein COB35_05085 [Gammaproteobacteria bacterium]|nr:MAG: hypothetical protein COB35_05085 [Gammaproteobacteria bacterium]